MIYSQDYDLKWNSRVVLDEEYYHSHKHVLLDHDVALHYIPYQAVRDQACNQVGIILLALLTVPDVPAVVAPPAPLSPVVFVLSLELGVEVEEDDVVEVGLEPEPLVSLLNFFEDPVSTVSVVFVAVPVSL
jgi:hypothetical protein